MEQQHTPEPPKFCRCGLSLDYDNRYGLDPDPWCTGCNMSATVCDCCPAPSPSSAEQGDTVPAKACVKCGERLTGHEDDSGTHCRWCVTCSDSASASKASECPSCGGHGRQVGAGASVSCPRCHGTGAWVAGDTVPAGGGDVVEQALAIVMPTMTPAAVSESVRIVRNSIDGLGGTRALIDKFASRIVSDAARLAERDDAIKRMRYGLEMVQAWLVSDDERRLNVPNSIQRRRHEIVAAALAALPGGDTGKDSNTEGQG